MGIVAQTGVPIQEIWVICKDVSREERVNIDGKSGKANDGIESSKVRLDRRAEQRRGDNIEDL